MKTSDALFDALKRHGVKTVFLVAGGGAMHLVDSMGKSGIPYVAMTHEQGAGYAAVGYAQATGRIGVCLVTSGPGVTNAVTPCAAAWTDSVPVLFISGQAHTKSLANGQRTRGQQEICTIDIVRAITKQSHEAHEGRAALQWLGQMIIECESGRSGPCWLSVPLDVQAEEINV